MEDKVQRKREHCISNEKNDENGRRSTKKKELHLLLRLSETRTFTVKDLILES